MRDPLRPDLEVPSTTEPGDGMTIVVERQEIPWPRALVRMVLNPTRGVQLLLVVTFVIAWEVGGRILSEPFLPTPSGIAEAGIDMIETGELLDATKDSLASLAVGYGAAVLIGVTLGFAIGWYRFLGAVLNPFVSALYVIPAAGLVPLLVIWFGLGSTPRILTVILFSVFEILLSTVAGVRNVDQTLTSVARSFGASRLQLFRKVVFFAALPYIFVGLRMGVARALKGMVVAELLFAVTGIGGAIWTAANYYRIDQVFVYVIELALIGVVLAALIQLVERIVLPWKAHETR